MGNLNQLEYIRKYRSLMMGPWGPVLEIGSKDYGNTPNYRPEFPGVDYVGIDLEAGAGVDIVIDMAQSFERIDQLLGGKRFNTIICFSVMEHCKELFQVADNIQRLLAPKGRLIVSVPFSWEYHGYPSDYWRFTPEGIKQLFSGLIFDNQYSECSTGVDGESEVIANNEFYLIDLVPKVGLRKKRYGLVDAVVIKLLKVLGLLKPLLSHQILMPTVAINMIGKRK